MTISTNSVVDSIWSDKIFVCKYSNMKKDNGLFVCARVHNLQLSHFSKFSEEGSSDLWGCWAFRDHSMHNSDECKALQFAIKFAKVCLKICCIQGAETHLSYFDLANLCRSSKTDRNKMLVGNY